jgi:predicted nucleotidyltransferase
MGTKKRVTGGLVRPMDALFSPSEQRLIGAVLLNPGRDFGTLELLTRIGTSRSAGKSLIDRWVSAGVLRERRVGNQRRLSANPDYLLYPELRTMALKTIGLAEPLAKALSPLKHRLTDAFVFGSIAAGRDTSKSDIDLALVGEVDLFQVSPLIDAAEHELGRPVHVSVYGTAEWADASAPVLDVIRNGPRIDLMELMDGTTR